MPKNILRKDLRSVFVQFQAVIPGISRYTFYIYIYIYIYIYYYQEDLGLVSNEQRSQHKLVTALCYARQNVK